MRIGGGELVAWAAALAGGVLVSGAVHASALGRLFWELAPKGALKTLEAAEPWPALAALALSTALLTALLRALAPDGLGRAAGLGALFGLALALPAYLTLSATWTVPPAFILLDTGLRIAEHAVAAPAAWAVLRYRAG